MDFQFFRSFFFLLYALIFLNIVIFSVSLSLSSLKFHYRFSNRSTFNPVLPFSQNFSLIHMLERSECHLE